MISDIRILSPIEIKNSSQIFLAYHTGFNIIKTSFDFKTPTKGADPSSNLIDQMIRIPVSNIFLTCLTQIFLALTIRNTNIGQI